MTTIATDGKTIAGDSQMQTDFVCQGGSKKLFTLKDGSIVGFCGQSQFWLPLVEWLNGGDRPELKDAEFGAIILTPEGRIFHLDDGFYKTECPPPYAMGSGGGFAMGAMLAGKTPEEAVKIAAKLDVYTGGKITVMRPK